MIMQFRAIGERKITLGVNLVIVRYLIKVLKVLLAGLICRYIMVGRRGSRFLG